MLRNAEFPPHGIRHGLAAAVILLVEPEPLQRELLRRVLAAEGHTVHVADGGDAAVLAVLRRRPEAIVVSDHLPDGSSSSFVRWVRAELAGEISVLVLANDGKPDAAVRAYDAGADMVVCKPTDLDLFGRTVNALIRRVRPPSQASFPTPTFERPA